MVVVTARDRLAAGPLGIRWLPAARVVDGAWIALVVAGGVGAARLARRLDAMPIMERLGVSPRSPAFGLGAAALFALLSLGSDTLMLRPGAGVWPSLSSIERGLRLPDFWSLLGRLAESTAFRRRLSLAPFVVFTRESAVALPTPRDGVWRTTLAGEAGGWTCARVAYYPLWRADADGAPLPTRRGADGLLEVRLTRALQTVTLRYDPGVPELAGVVLSAVALAALAGSAWRSG